MPIQSVTAAALLGLLLLMATPIAAQDDSASSAAVAALLEEARDRQEEFERYRASSIPVTRERSQPRCDELIGRICIWFGGEGEAGYPREAPEVGEARVELISFLAETARRAPGRWVIGQPAPGHARPSVGFERARTRQRCPASDHRRRPALVRRSNWAA